MDALGGTKYWGASYELQMPFWFPAEGSWSEGARSMPMPGGLSDYKGPTTRGPANRGIDDAGQLELCQADGLACDQPEPARVSCMTMAMWVRSSVVVGLIWGLAVRTAAVRLCGSADQGPV